MRSRESGVRFEIRSAVGKIEKIQLTCRNLECWRCYGTVRAMRSLEAVGLGVKVHGDYSIPMEEMLAVLEGLQLAPER